jgi:hypothetical protein
VNAIERIIDQTIGRLLDEESDRLSERDLAILREGRENLRSEAKSVDDNTTSPSQSLDAKTLRAIEELVRSNLKEALAQNSEETPQLTSVTTAATSETEREGAYQDTYEDFPPKAETASTTIEIRESNQEEETKTKTETNRALLLRNKNKTELK